MNRRQFLQRSLAGGATLMLPTTSYSATQELLDNVQFNTSIYNANRPRTIMVFLYGGASQLGGNFTNFEAFKDYSQSSYENHFGSGNLVATPNGFWQAAGGTLMEELVASGDLSVLRTCYSQVREVDNNKSHGSCVAQNQRGSFNENTSGIFATLAQILYRNNIVDQNSFMPFLSMEGDSLFFTEGETWLETFLKPLSINERLDNPYHRGYDPHYSAAMDILAQSMNPEGKIKDAFTKRAELEDFIDNIADNTPAEAEYSNNSFAQKLKTAINVMSQNPDTLIISTGSGGLGGWDDHNDAENYLNRMNQLFSALKSATIHLKDADPDGHINIMIMGEFGRGINLNSAMGWDHGNLQNLHVLGGQRYFNNLGAFGSTRVEYGGDVGRIYLKPAQSSYWFEPPAVAATLYSIFGIENPETLTDSIQPITPLLT